MSQPDFDVPAAHRWFGVECNNTAWTLLERPGRTGEETERLLHAAHAALLHWGDVGTPVNRVRGLALLTTAYAAAGREEEAIRWAGACLALSEELGAATDGGDKHQAVSQTAFDRACVHGAAAAAFRLAEYADEAAEHAGLAREALAGCDAEECGVIGKFYGVAR